MYTPTYILYVATPTGWAYKTYTTTSNPTILKDQQIYKQYLIKRAGEIAKIAGLATFYLNQAKMEEIIDGSLKEELQQIRVGGYAHSPNGLAIANIMPPDGDINEFFLNLYKKIKDKINEGRTELRNGNYVQGMINITIGTGGFTLWGTTLTSYLIDENWPKDLWPKIK